MVGITLVTKDEVLQKRVKRFCEKYDCILFCFQSFAKAKKEFKYNQTEFVLFDESNSKKENIENMLKDFKNAKLAFFGVEQKENKKGVCCLPLKNFSQTLLRFVSNHSLFCVERGSGKVVDLKKRVSTFCLEAGIMPHLSGYKYVVYAIMLTILNVEKAKFLTKQIYPQIAKKFGVSSQIVERTIRHALIAACQNGKLAKINELIEADVFLPHERISNGQFISVVADRFLYKLKILNNAVDINAI